MSACEHRQIIANAIAAHDYADTRGLIDLDEEDQAEYLRMAKKVLESPEGSAWNNDCHRERSSR